MQTFHVRWVRWFLSICLVSMGSLWIAQRPPTVQAAPAATTLAGETIVYIKENRQLWLIQPDGSNDRLIWQIPEGAIGELDSVAWRPDAQQIAFVSTHEATCSEWHADIFLINPDGTGLRRLTNGPACGELAGYPQGSATVQIENQLSNVSQVLVYIEGAPTAKVVNIAPGSTVMVAFPQVADLGAGLGQQVVVINGSLRWFDAAVQADVLAGQNVHAGKLTLASSGFDTMGALKPSWNPAGTKLAYQFGQGRLWQVGLDVAILSEGGPLLDPQINNTVLGTNPVWSPNSNQFLYQRFGISPVTITRAEVDGNSLGTELATATLTQGIGWLMDGSGFVVADHDALLSHVDLYLVRFADNSITQLTQTTLEAAVYPKVAPDNSQIVYTYVADLQARPLQPELRIMNIDGSADHLLVKGGALADWSRVAPQNPPATPQPTATATTAVQPTTVSTATSQPITTPTATAQPGVTPAATSQPGVTPAATAQPGELLHTIFLPRVTR